MKNSKKQTKKWTRKTKDKRNKKTQKKKTKQNERKEREREWEKKLFLQPTSFLRMVFFHMWFTCFFINVSWAQSVYVIEFMLSVRCYFFVKAIVFFELFKRISFSILLTFRISAMKLFRFMNFFSLDI